MMNSKECLYAILDMLNHEQIDECDKKDLLRIIKQDLDRLEQLEKENQELKEDLEESFDYNALRQLKINSLEEKNTKLKKAFEILKHKFEIKGVKEYLDGYVIDTKLYYIGISQEEYELLEEVLE